MPIQPIKTLRISVVALALLLLLGGCGNASGQSEPSPVPDEPSVSTGTDSGGSDEAATEAPDDDTMRLTVPEMERVKDVEIPTAPGNDEDLLRENAAIHLLHTGYPWQEEANVYIAGHRLGYRGTDSYLAFYDIDRLEEGDEIYITDSDGKRYTYRVFETLTVEPTEIDVLNPIEGKNIVSLQACTLPDYSDRIIVRGELVGS